MPPSLREWLPDNHFAWFVLDCVAGFDLSAFYADYRADGHGRAAHDPSMMVALLLYSYARGTRSSRAIERGCIEDVACRVIAANRVPDHCTISRFRQRHQAALAGLFGDVLALCAQAGLIGLDVVAVDGTKVHANASHHANRDYEQLAREVLEHAAETDRRRTSSSVTAAATSCRRSSRPVRGDGPGCLMPSGGWRRNASRRRGRSRGLGRLGRARPSAVSRKTSPPRSTATSATRPTGRAG